MSQTTASHKLLTPHPKMAQRLEREAIKKVAEERKLHFLEVQDIYNNTRTALAHLKAHNRYCTRFADMADELALKVEQLMATADTHGLNQHNNAWLKKVAVLTEIVKAEKLKYLSESAVNIYAIQLFLEVVQAIQDVYKEGEYNFENVISAELVVLAMMITDNFSAYEKTLNT